MPLPPSHRRTITKRTTRPSTTPSRTATNAAIAQLAEQLESTTLAPSQPTPTLPSPPTTPPPSPHPYHLLLLHLNHPTRRLHPTRPHPSSARTVAHLRRLLGPRLHAIRQTRERLRQLIAAGADSNALRAAIIASARARAIAALFAVREAGRGAPQAEDGTGETAPDSGRVGDKDARMQ